MMKPVLTLTLCIFFCGLELLAQDIDTTHTIDFPHEIIAKRYAKSIKLRWAPKTKGKWLDTRFNTIQISRAEIINGIPQSYEVIASDVRVESAAQIEQRLEGANGDKYLAVGYAYYGKWESLDKANQWGTKSDELDSKYMVILYSSDMDFDVAQCAGLAYEDRSIDPNAHYAYRLEIIDDAKYKRKHKSVSNLVEEDRGVVIDQWEENEQEVIIGWSRVRYAHQYSGYYIERSIDNRNYTRLNNIPYIHTLTDHVDDLAYMIWQDSVSNYTPHYYRVIGIDAFGEESTSLPGVRLMGKDRTPPTMPVIHSTSLSADQSHVLIEWSHEDAPDDLARYIIKKSSSPAGKYVDLEVVAKSTLQYRDTSPSIVADQYYKVCAVDTASNTICTYPKYALIQDKIAPLAPKGLEGIIDTNGVVTITWHLGKEADLYGYKVHMANRPDRPFTPITPKPIKSNMYRDTLELNTLTEYIYYRVTAFDLRQNASEYSKVLQLKKPDIIPPAPAVFTSYQVTKEHIELYIASSKSKDVDTQVLLRRGDDGPWTEVSLLSATDTLYIDSDIDDKTVYTYDLVVADDNGNKTHAPQMIRVSTLDTKHHQSIQLSGQSTDDGYLLSWPNDMTLEKIRIYRSINDRFITYKVIEGNISQYLDEINENHSYKVKLYYADGAVSTSSNIVSQKSTQGE